MKYVCTDCFDDSDLRDFIEGMAEEGVGECSFCDAEGQSTVVCQLNDVLQHIKECVLESYDLAANCLGWEGREGGWQGADYWDTPDLLREKIGLELPNDADDSLFNAICNHLGHADWCQQDPYSESPLERFRFDWDKFTSVVKHHTRFFISTYDQPRHPLIWNDRADPLTFLAAIGRSAQRLGLFGELKEGATLYRARRQTGAVPFESVGELGPPPEEKALMSNRMSPPGIVMFYGAIEAQTALLETAKEAGVYRMARFRVLRPLGVLDLTGVPAEPGFFAEVPDSQEWRRHEARFFREFVEDLTKPIERDERIHLDYVSTQVLVEYFRREFPREFNVPPVDGVLYPSARVNGGIAMVLFCGREAILPVEEPDEFGLREEREPWLEFIGQSPMQFSPS